MTKFDVSNNPFLNDDQSHAGAAAAIFGHAKDRSTKPAVPRAKVAPVDPKLVEDAAKSAVEVRVLWGDEVLYVDHRNDARPFTVGEAAGSDFVVPGSDALRVIDTDGKRSVVVAPANGKTTVTDSAGSRELMPGERCELTSGTSVRVERGEIAIVASGVVAGKRTGRGLFRGDNRALGFFAGTFAAAALVMGSLAAVTPPLGLQGEEGISHERIVMLQAYLESAAEREEERVKTEQPSGDDGSTDSAPSEGAPGEAGAAGKPDAVASKGAMRVKGPAGDRSLSRAEAVRDAQTFGMIDLLGSLSSPDGSAMANPWGSVATGGDDRDVYGNMYAGDLNDVAGVGGLTLSGPGNGGGNPFGEEAKLTGIRTCGLAGECGAFDGYRGPKLRDHITRVEEPRIGDTEASARLPATVIQRIVRQNHGRFRLCYENGLRANPNLAGRVAVSFTIGRDGSVMMARNAGSDLPDSAVVSCVVRAYYGLSFPAPEVGTVNVTYPIAFSPTGA